jgi:hypothetical protein
MDGSFFTPALATGFAGCSGTGLGMVFAVASGVGLTAGFGSGFATTGLASGFASGFGSGLA